MNGKCAFCDTVTPAGCFVSAIEKPASNFVRIA
jgi:hypothetical protein